MLINYNRFLIYRFQYLSSLYLKRTKTFSTSSSSSSSNTDSTMKKLVDLKQYEKALDLFNQESDRCSNFTINMAIKSCTQLRDYKRGINIQQKLSSNSLNDPYIQTSLIHFYMQCHRIDNANRLFSTIIKKSNAMYTAMFKGLISNKMPQKVFDLLDEMTIKPDRITLILLFQACAQLSNDRARKIGKELFDQMLNNTRNDDITLTSALHMLMRFGDVKRAEYVFELIKEKGIITYGAMMKGYSENQMSGKTLDLFEQMKFNPNDNIYTIVFKACAQLANDRAIKIGKTLVDQMPDSCRNNNIVLTSALHMLMKFGDVKRAEYVFESIREKNVITYGAVMKGYSENQMSDKALDLFEQMKFNPNDNIYTIVFKACTQLANDRAIKIGKTLVDQMSDSCRNNNIVLTSALHMLMKFGDVKRAEYVFESIREKNVITYGAMMIGYSENQMSDKALDLFEQMKFNPDDNIYTIVFKACAQLANDRAIKIGKTLLDQMPDKMLNNKVLLTSAIHMLMKLGDIKRAEYVFESIREKNSINYGAMMKGYNINNEPWKCLKIFEEMKQLNLFADEITYTILIGACAQIGILTRCEIIVNQIPLHMQNKQQIQNSLIDMWGKAGSIEKAKEIFKSISNPDVVTYSAMINAFGLNGMGSEAVELYREMPINLRNDISRVCVLNACSHSGLLNEAYIIFNEITIKTERIVTVLIDCLSRLFLFDEAQKLIDSYEKTNSPSFIMYMAMLSGARNNRNNILSTKIYNRMKVLFPDQKKGLLSGAILLSNIYSSMGDHQQAGDIRTNEIRGSQVKVKPGVTWTDVNGQLVKFGAHDYSHPQFKEICAEVERFVSELTEHGHHFDASWITRPLNQDETIESVLCGHSEILALAYNLIQRPIPSFVQLTKNLRICGSCHQATKLLAKIRKCEIIVRDGNRIHHFNMNGQCSCQDHF